MERVGSGLGVRVGVGVRFGVGDAVGVRVPSVNATSEHSSVGPKPESCSEVLTACRSVTREPVSGGSVRQTSQV